MAKKSINAPSPKPARTGKPTITAPDRRPAPTGKPNSTNPLPPPLAQIPGVS